MLSHLAIPLHDPFSFAVYARARQFRPTVMRVPTGFISATDYEFLIDWAASDIILT